MDKVILVIAPFFSTNSRQNRPFFVARVLAKFGQVDILTTNFNHLTKKRKESKQVQGFNKIIYVSTLPYGSNVGFTRFLSHILFSIKAIRYFLTKREKYDVVYVTVPFNLSASMVFQFAGSKTKIIDIIDIWPDVLPFPKLIRVLALPLMKIWKHLFFVSCQKTDILMAVSERFFLQGIQSFKGEAHNAKRFYIGAESLLNADIQKNELITIAFVGNIGRLYDFQTLIKALDDHSLIYKYQLIIIGDGDKKGWLIDELNRKKISFKYFGIVYDPNDLAAILGTAHLGFNGYTGNTTAAFSYKASTYLAAGLPLINSMSGDLNYLVELHEIGFNYHPGDYLSLRKILLNIDTNQLSTMSSNCKVFYQNELNYDTLYKQMVEFFSQTPIND